MFKYYLYFEDTNSEKLVYHVVVIRELSSTWKIFKWEIERLTANWQRTAAVLLLPAAFMMIALNIFPLLINYMSTGSLGMNQVIAVNAPESFEDHVNRIKGTTVYNIKLISTREYEQEYTEDKFINSLKKGTIWVIFKDGELPFDDEIARYYDNLAQGYVGAVSHASIEIIYDESSALIAPRVSGFTQVVIDPYKSSLLTTLGGDFSDEGKDSFVTDEFNIVTKIMDNRSVANINASRVIPGIVMLLAYYCVYSLACDLFAMEKDRGFYNKLVLTPISQRSIISGKVLTMMLVSLISSLITIFLMFMTSWLNWSNDSMSLLPFGMMLTPATLLLIMIVMAAAVYLMSAAAVYIVFTLQKLQDMLINLQLPLILFLIDFFLNLFRSNRPLSFEYLIPFHNNICLIRDAYASQAQWWMVLLVLFIDIFGGYVIFRDLIRKAENT